MTLLFLDIFSLGFLPLPLQNLINSQRYIFLILILRWLLSATPLLYRRHFSGLSSGSQKMRLAARECTQKKPKMVCPAYEQSGIQTAVLSEQ